MSTRVIEVPTILRKRARAVSKEKGDPVVFREIVEQHSPRIHAIAYQMVGNSEDAKDITQEVCLKLYRSLDKFNPEHNYTAWLYRLTVNLSIDYLRKNTRERKVSLDKIEEKSILKNSIPQPDSDAENSELKGIILKIAMKLTLKERKVFVLRDLQGFSTEEVARILKCRQSTVRVHLASARGRIKEALLKYYPNLVI